MLNNSALSQGNMQHTGNYFKRSLLYTSHLIVSVAQLCISLIDRIKSAWSQWQSHTNRSTGHFSQDVSIEVSIPTGAKFFVNCFYTADLELVMCLNKIFNNL